MKAKPRLCLSALGLVTAAVELLHALYDYMLRGEAREA